MSFPKSRNGISLPCCYRGVSRYSREQQLLILDAGGVLVSEPMPALIGQLEADSALAPGEAEAFYRRELREPLWEGRLGIEEFWQRLIAGTQVSGAPEIYRAIVEQGFHPLPALARLPEWSQQAQITVLSNHRHEWLRPLLAQAAVLGCIDHLLISSEINVCKPALRAFELAKQTAGPQTERMLFIDDQPKNIDPARAQAELPGMVAARSEGWIERCERWLAGGELED